MNNQPTTLKAVLNASNSLIEKHTRLVQFIYNTFGEEGLEELELYSCKIGALIQEQELAFVSKDGIIEIKEEK